MTLRVALAEDNLLVREGLCSLLATRPDLDVCGTAGDLTEALDLVEAVAPDVVITDIRMPPSHTDEGVQLAASLLSSHPGTGVVVLSQFADPDYALAVFEHGSARRAYVLKDRLDDVEHLVAAISAVARGGSFIDNEVVDALVAGRARVSDSPLSHLSPRELDVIGGIAAGGTNASIAESLGVSSHAVEKHISSIFAKLGLTADDRVNRRVMAVLMFLGGRDAPSAGGT